MGSAIGGSFQGSSYSDSTSSSLGHLGKEQAKRIGAATRERALGQVDQRKGMLVEQLRGVLQSLKSVQKEAPEGAPQQWIGKATGVLQQACDTVENRSTRELIDQVQGQMRSRPGAWIAGCLAVGFLAGRVLRT